eukprot:GHVT01048740.1.p1 GENE.GHVT01048740.1~~GHVT01048740.1.p1  ORF type:complete len:441 (+),score=74.36 GHVT01048740.1:325-1647(+)
MQRMEKFFDLVYQPHLFLLFMLSVIVVSVVSLGLKICRFIRLDPCRFFRCRDANTFLLVTMTYSPAADAVRWALDATDTPWKCVSFPPFVVSQVVRLMTAGQRRSPPVVITPEGGWLCGLSTIFLHLDRLKDGPSRLFPSSKARQLFNLFAEEEAFEVPALHLTYAMLLNDENGNGSEVMRRIWRGRPETFVTSSSSCLKSYATSCSKNTKIHALDLSTSGTDSHSLHLSSSSSASSSSSLPSSFSSSSSWPDGMWRSVVVVVARAKIILLILLRLISPLCFPARLFPSLAQSITDKLSSSAIASSPPSSGSSSSSPTASASPTPASSGFRILGSLDTVLFPTCFSHLSARLWSRVRPLAAFLLFFAFRGFFQLLWPYISHVLRHRSPWVSRSAMKDNEERVDRIWTIAETALEQRTNASLYIADTNQPSAPGHNSNFES